MRKYPKKCPKCNKYGEPVFDFKFSSLANGSSVPDHWTCVYCEEDFNYIDDED